MYHYHARAEQGEVEVMDVRVAWVIFSHLCIRQPRLIGALRQRVQRNCSYKKKSSHLLIHMCVND